MIFSPSACSRPIFITRTCVQLSPTLSGVSFYFSKFSLIPASFSKRFVKISNSDSKGTLLNKPKANSKKNPGSKNKFTPRPKFIKPKSFGSKKKLLGKSKFKSKKRFGKTFKNKKRKHLPPLFYKHVYPHLRRESVRGAKILRNIFNKNRLESREIWKKLLVSPKARLLLNSSTSNNSWGKEELVSAEGKTSVSRKRGKHVADSLAGAGFAKFNLPRLHWKNAQGKGLKLWRAKRKWAWRYLKRIRMDKKLVRVFARVSQWPFSRLNYAYIYDIFMFWFILHLKRSQFSLHTFFFKLWLNIYFSQLLSFSTNLFNSLNLGRTNFFSYYGNMQNMRMAAIINKGLLFRGILFFHRPFSFTRFFKLMATFWNRYKTKHFALGLTSWRWKSKFKPNAKTKSFLRKKRKKIKHRYFLVKKHLRFRFKRQHGYGLVFNYFLRSQLRRLKRILPRKLRIVSKKKKVVPHYYKPTSIPEKGKLIIGSHINFGSDLGSVSSLRRQRVKLLNRMIYEKGCLALRLNKQLGLRSQLMRHVHLLAKIKDKGANLKGNSKLLSLIFGLDLLRNRFLLKEKNFRKFKASGMVKPKMYIKNLIRESSKRFYYPQKKEIPYFTKDSSLRDLFSQFFFRIFPEELAPKYFSSFKQWVVLRDYTLDLPGEEGGEIAFNLCMDFLASVFGPKFIHFYYKGLLHYGRAFVKALKVKAHSPFKLFLRNRLIHLRYRARRISARSGRRKKNIGFGRKNLRRLIRHKSYYYKRANFSTIYNKLLEGKLSLKFLKNSSTQSKCRRRRSFSSRRKLLIVNGLKKVLWKTSGAPVFLSKIDRRIA